ncbi:MAG: hypothetical protein KDD47_07755, partial [Acidobacteria bacterium]|nr:hypothetical protein [Acidobacteriota bacterium]
VADAATLCREGDIPTSKIYRAMEKLSSLGVVEIQPTRPKLYAMVEVEVAVDRLVEVARARAERFASRCDALRRTLAEARGRAESRKTFTDLALGVESHVKRHLVQLAGAERRILSYLEEGDLKAIDQQEGEGFRIVKRIGRSLAESGAEHRLIFGFRYASAPVLTAFLRHHGAALAQSTAVRYSGELGHPFHVVDDELVILSLDHPFVAEGRFASLLVRDRDLAAKLTKGFEGLWAKAMKDLREVRFQPHA